jgi:predicted exporter
LFGCYLILGLGMDYAIFSFAEGTQDQVTRRAIWLSAVTSSLSFGLLALSSTPMVSAFGITLLLGCCFNLFYAPLVGQLHKNRLSARVE